MLPFESSRGLAWPTTSTLRPAGAADGWKPTSVRAKALSTGAAVAGSSCAAAGEAKSANAAATVARSACQRAMAPEYWLLSSAGCAPSRRHRAADRRLLALPDVDRPRRPGADALGARHRHGRDGLHPGVAGRDAYRRAEPDAPDGGRRCHLLRQHGHPLPDAQVGRRRLRCRCGALLAVCAVVAGCHSPEEQTAAPLPVRGPAHTLRVALDPAFAEATVARALSGRFQLVRRSRDRIVVARLGLTIVFRRLDPYEAVRASSTRPSSPRRSRLQRSGYCPAPSRREPRTRGEPVRRSGRCRESLCASQSRRSVSSSRLRRLRGRTGGSSACR